MSLWRTDLQSEKNGLPLPPLVGKLVLYDLGDTSKDGNQFSSRSCLKKKEEQVILVGCVSFIIDWIVVVEGLLYPQFYFCLFKGQYISKLVEIW